MRIVNADCIVDSFEVYFNNDLAILVKTNCDLTLQANLMLWTWASCVFSQHLYLITYYKESDGNNRGITNGLVGTLKAYKESKLAKQDLKQEYAQEFGRDMLDAVIHLKIYGGTVPEA